MNFSRYKFSKQSEPELQIFFEAVAKQNNPCSTSKYRKLWEHFLPIDKTIYSKFKTTVDDKVIEILDDSDTLQPEDSIKLHELHESVSEEPINFSDTFHKLKENVSDEPTDFIAALQESLETEECLPEDMIIQLGSICAHSIHQKLLQEFAKNINTQYAYKLWKSLNLVVGIEQKQAIIYFIQTVLIEKILKGDDKITKILFRDVCNSHSNEVATSLIQTVKHPNFANDCKILNRNLISLQENHKNIFLSVFKLKCTKLELHHIGIITALLSPKTNHETIFELVELMCHVAKDYAAEKPFGKLILDVIQILDVNVLQIEAKITSLVNSNKSVFKAQASKLLEKHLQNRLLGL